MPQAQTTRMWVSDWILSDTLDAIFGKDCRMGEEFLDQLDKSEDFEEYPGLMQHWARVKSLPLKFHAVRVADTDDHYEWDVEFTNPTGKLLRIYKEVLAKNG